MHWKAVDMGVRSVVAFAVALSAAMSIAATGPASADINTVLVNDSSSTFKVRPSLIGYTGDGTGYFGRRTWGGKRGYVKWQKWGSYSARGVGTVWLNNCQPACYNGKWKSRKGWIQLGAPRNGKFTTMTVTFRRGNRMVSDTRKIRRVDTYWIWAIVNR